MELSTKKIRHTTFRNNALFCTHCGQSKTYELPISISEFTKLIDAFNVMHGDCKPVWKQPEADLSTSVEERMLWWTVNGEHGTASNTIWCKLCFGETGNLKFNYEILKNVAIPPSQYSHPDDPDSFSRCYLLLKNIPELRAQLPEMKPLSPVWEKLVDNWDKFTAMYEQNLAEDWKNYEQIGMYELMKELGC